MKTEPENKRQHILDIATTIFAKYGFAKTTLDDIADAVGMKKGSLYYYFKSKEAIFSAVINEVASQVFTRMKKDVSTETTARGAVLKFVESGLRCSQDAGNVIGVSAQVKLELLPLAHQILKDFHDDMLAFLSAIIDRGVKLGEFRPCDSKKITHAIHSAAQGIEWNALCTSGSIQGKQEFDIEPIVKEALFLVDLILDGLRPVGSQPSTSSLN